MRPVGQSGHRYRAGIAEIGIVKGDDGDVIRNMAARPAQFSDEIIGDNIVVAD